MDRIDGLVRCAEVHTFRRKPMPTRRQANLAARIAALPAVPTIVGQVALAPEISEIVDQVFDLACLHLGEEEARSLFANVKPRPRGRPKGSRRVSEPAVKLKRIADDNIRAGFDRAEVITQLAEWAAGEKTFRIEAIKKSLRRRLRAK
jgi:hypothetical protein